MMGMCDVGRIVGSVALILGVLMGPFNAFPYGSAATHLEVTDAILGGYGGDDFQEFFGRTSGALDSMADDFEAHFPEMRKKFNPWTHRLMGHSWSLDEGVPEWVLRRMEEEYGVSRSKVIRYCKEYQEMIIETAIEMTGLARDPATAFAALVIDLHQLQDLEPGNRAVKYVGRIETVTANINRHIGVLLVDRPEYAAVLQKKLNGVLNAGRKDGLSEKEMAKKMIDALMACHLGTAIYSCHRETMKLSYNIDRVVAANGKAAAARAKFAIAKANRAMAAGREVSRGQTPMVEYGWWSRGYDTIRFMRPLRNFKANQCCHLVSRIANRAFFLNAEEDVFLRESVGVLLHEQSLPHPRVRAGSPRTV